MCCCAREFHGMFMEAIDKSLSGGGKIETGRVQKSCASDIRTRKIVDWRSLCAVQRGEGEQ